MELSPGAAVGPYRLVEKADEGGMAEVWRAYDARLDRYVAIKFLARRFAGESGYLDRFRREARSVSALDYPHILPIWDYGEQDDWTYMVSPFLEGGTLARRLGRPWSVADALSVLRPLAAALDYAHARGIVHRDVKPSNVLFSGEGRLILGDFGIARALEGTAMLTQAGALVGTPAYMAPEQAEGQPASPASDLYALGVVAYELLTGRPPFQAATPLAVMMAHVHQPLPPPSSINPALPRAVEAVLLKALAKSPHDRFPSGAAFVAALSAVEPAPGADASTIVERRAATDPSPASRRPPAASWQQRLGLPLAGLAALILVVVGIVLVVRDDSAGRGGSPTATPAGVAKASPVAVAGSPVAVAGSPATIAGSPVAAAVPSPTRPPASPTPTEAQAVQSALAAIAEPWSRGAWETVVSTLAPLQARYPANPTLKDKLYAAYVEQGRALETAEQPVEARDAYAAAERLHPGRPEAAERLEVLRPVGEALAWRIYRWRPGPTYEDEFVRAQQDGDVYMLAGKNTYRSMVVGPPTGVVVGEHFVARVSARLPAQPGGLDVTLFENAGSAWASFILRMIRLDSGQVWVNVLRANAEDGSKVDAMTRVGPNSSILAPAGQPNAIRIEKRGTTVTFAVNGSSIWSGPLNRPVGWVALAPVTEGQAGTRVGVLEYLVYEPR